MNVESNSSTVRNIVECVTVGAGDHITGISRLGRKQAKGDRPIKVEFSSSSIPSKILRNKIKLTQNTTYSKIKISDDMTPTQLNEIKKVREDLKRREAAGEKGITIKYVKGSPKIVPVQPTVASKN